MWWSKEQRAKSKEQRVKEIVTCNLHVHLSVHVANVRTYRLRRLHRLLCTQLRKVVVCECTVSVDVGDGTTLFL